MGSLILLNRLIKPPESYKPIVNSLEANFEVSIYSKLLQLTRVFLSQNKESSHYTSEMTLEPILRYLQSIIRINFFLPFSVLEIMKYSMGVNKPIYSLIEIIYFVYFTVQIRINESKSRNFHWFSDSRKSYFF